MIADHAIVLRPTTPEDLDFAWGLYRDLMKPLTEELLVWHDTRQKDVVARDVVTRRASIIMANGQKAGWLRVRELPDAIELCQFYLLRTQQNRGIGTAILRRLMGQARRDRRSVTLAVMKNNRASLLYERLGFVRTGEDGYKLRMTWRSADPN